MLKSINVIADIDAEEFKKNVCESIENMQNDNLKVEAQYTTEIQLDGKLLFTVMLIGREASKI